MMPKISKAVRPARAFVRNAHEHDLPFSNELSFAFGKFPAQLLLCFPINDISIKWKETLANLGATRAAKRAATEFLHDTEI